MPQIQTYLVHFKADVDPGASEEAHDRSLSRWQIVQAARPEAALTEFIWFHELVERMDDKERTSEEDWKVAQDLVSEILDTPMNFKTGRYSHSETLHGMFFILQLG